MSNTLPITNWLCTRTAANQFEQPENNLFTLESFSFQAPKTIAASLLEGEIYNKDLSNLDSFDWWMQSTFTLDEKELSTLAFLECEGLATLGEVWLNGEKVANFNNMFLPVSVCIESKLAKENTLIVVIRSNQAFLNQKRPRPAWKTNLIENQNLRWLRTSLLGYIPSWTPDIKPLGIWKALSLKSQDQKLLDSVCIHSSVDGSEGIVNLTLDLPASYFSHYENKKIRLSICKKNYELKLKIQNDSLILKENVCIEKVDFWLPHTHGEPTLYAWEMQLSGATVSRKGKIGFRRAEFSYLGESIGLKINGKRIFCRGACWTTSDIVSLTETEASIKQKLKRFKEASMNMLRVGGTMLYEHDRFYELCDELGILVWQDFMFANMDYPVEEESFLKNITDEVLSQVGRLVQYASVVVYCGGSEVEQQSAMMGMSREHWRNHFFSNLIPEIGLKIDANFAYVPSSPCEGALPFHSSEGIAHYFGVGAYQRGLKDLIEADVKFATECLAFSNIPSPAHLQEMFKSVSPPTHTPSWKEGVPRDNHAGWDFEDVRDFYVKKLFGIDAVQLRYENLEQYHRLARLISGYVMARCMIFWRSETSRCSGALIWFYNDIVAGAGWGLIDHSAAAKPALNILEHSLNTHQCYVLNQGLAGHRFGVINEGTQDKSYTLRVALLREASATYTFDKVVRVAANKEHSLNLAEIASGFIDSTHSYRFGAERFEAVAVQLFDEQGHLLSQDIEFPQLIPMANSAASLNATVEAELSVLDKNKGQARLQLRTNRALYFAELDCKRIQFNHNYIHLLPGHTYVIDCNLYGDSSNRIRVSLGSVNGAEISLNLTG